MTDGIYFKKTQYNMMKLTIYHLLESLSYTIISPLASETNTLSSKYLEQNYLVVLY